MASSANQLQVAVHVGGGAAEVRTFEPGEVRVGRRPQNDIVIDGEGLKVVSGFHLRFAYESDRWCVEDRESTNGTYLNGMRVTGLQAVRDGDVVELGRPRRGSSHRSVQLHLTLQVNRALPTTSGSDAPGLAQTLEVDVPDLASTVHRAPLPQPVKVPASKPPEIRVLIERIQERSRRLGEVCYRLDSRVEDLTSAVLERHAALALEELPGGPGFLKALLALEAERPGLTQAPWEELAPLERAEADARATAEAAALRLEFVSRARQEKAEAFTQLYRELKGSLRDTLRSLTEELAAEPEADPPRAVGHVAVWKQWSISLHHCTVEIERREAALAAASASLEEAAAAAKVAEEAWTAAIEHQEAARFRTLERRAAIEAALARNGTGGEDSVDRIGSARKQVAEQARRLIMEVLEVPAEAAGKLGALAGMEDARRLYREAAALRVELSDLEHGANA
ncbi:FHA domain protein [Planctomycetes bacterium Poly30]|uniref:FHA domain protein n=1 Tax=Saltatorellus ferox TaxID=2528018 RepID=A0A518EKM4_9BACT|nr:FHA domain protein [Planctomycetes bacterium Poly30]